ncbi:MAG: glycosidase [Chloroflexi bacterium]|nr:glycosidase [Chloroflexota bacterium]
MFTRHPNNPLISPKDVKPSRPDFEVIGSFNAGATTYNGETLLLLRVAERPIKTDPNVVLCPYLDDSGELVIKTARKDDPNFDTHDSRFALDKQSRELWLTSMSHLRLARSKDGVHFTIEEQPWLQSEPPYEAFGVEDARISHIEGKYFVNYTAVSSHGIATALVSTRDFSTIERHGIIFAPPNRDVTLFPEPIGGQYVCYHRPMPSGLGRLNIWMATSPDLIHWGELRIVLDAQKAVGRIGGGAPPIKTEAGWLSIYHAADANQRYTLSAFLTPLDEPGRIIAQSREPIFAPEHPYETSGFFGNVVFSCGTTVEGDTLRLYYGAADEHMALAEASLSEVIRSLQP